MLKKTLGTLAVAGALGSAPVIAGGDKAAYSEATWSSAESTPSLRMDTSMDFGMSAAPIEIGDGVLAAVFDAQFDGQVAEEATAVGASASRAGSGEISFSSSEGESYSTHHASAESAVKDEVFLFPAPLAHNDGTRYWKLDVSAADAKEVDRLATENVYVMLPIEDAIVDPQIALTSGPDGILNALSSESSTG